MVLRLTIGLALAMTPGFGYAVLAHEAIVDAAWLDTLKPLLLKRFPQSTEDDLRKAHAYAYGGAIIQDSGYYPFGSHLFSDLVHYVRSGDFIVSLLREAQDVNEYAFALGAVSHYAADDVGHSIATNHVVPMLYPKLRAQYGNTVTYENAPAAHLKTEFGFDVAQVARGRYGPDAYHDFIGFETAKPLLERAFKATYGLELKDLFFSIDLALGTYRHTVSSIVPGVTKVAWEMKKDELTKTNPTASRKKFVYNLSRAAYRREWGNEYKQPGVFSRIFAWLLSVVPKVGPFRALSFRPPTPAAEELFIRSFNATLDKYRSLVRGSESSSFTIPNVNFDTGRPIRAGQYEMADEAYAKLLAHLRKDHFAGVPAGLRLEILSFFSAAPSPVVLANKKKEQAQLINDIERLRNTAPSTLSRP